MKSKQILLRWLPGFLAFPIAGQIVVWTIGPVRDLFSATLAGVTLGLVVGSAQFWALKPMGVSLTWALASTMALTVASPIAWSLIDFDTSIYALTLWGLFCGLFLGFAQAFSQKLKFHKSAIWGVAVSATWGLAWFVSANVIVDADANYAAFGSTGAFVATAIQGFLLNSVLKKEQ